MKILGQDLQDLMDSCCLWLFPEETAKSQSASAEKDRDAACPIIGHDHLPACSLAIIQSPLLFSAGRRRPRKKRLALTHQRLHAPRRMLILNFSTTQRLNFHLLRASAVNPSFPSFSTSPLPNFPLFKTEDIPAEPGTAAPRIPSNIQTRRPHRHPAQRAA